MNGDYEKADVYLTETELLEMAKIDIAALLWLNGNCNYCKYGHRDEYFGANRWICTREKGAADCRPKWRYDNG